MTEGKSTNIIECLPKEATGTDYVYYKHSSKGCKSFEWTGNYCATLEIDDDGTRCGSCFSDRVLVNGICMEPCETG